MLYKDGKGIATLFLSRNSVPWRMSADKTAFECSLSIEAVREEFLSVATALIDRFSKLAFVAGAYSGTYLTVECVTPPSAMSRVYRKASGGQNGTVAAVFAKAPQHTTFVNKDVPVYTGVFFADSGCLLLEAAMQLVQAQRVSNANSSGAKLRLEKAQAHFDSMLASFMDGPIGVTDVAVSSASGVEMSIAGYTYYPGSSRQLTGDEVGAITSVYYPILDSVIGSEQPEVIAAARASLVDAINRNAPKVVNLNALAKRELTDQEYSSIADSLGSYLAMPIHLLDIVGNSMDEVDALSFADFVTTFAKRMSERFPESSSFNVSTAPRSLGEALFMDVAITDVRYLDSIDAFYHRAVRPDVVPASGFAVIPEVMKVHPSMIAWIDQVTWLGDRAFKVTKEGVEYTVTYPDHMGRNIKFTSTTSAAARGYLTAYHAWLDAVFGMVAATRNGTISPERLLHLGIRGVVTSTIFSVRS